MSLFIIFIQSQAVNPKFDSAVLDGKVLVMKLIRRMLVKYGLLTVMKYFSFG